MINKTTDELMSELVKANNITDYLKDNSQYMVDEDISVYLSNILEKKGLVKSAVVKKTELSEVTGYQIFSGIRKPSRDSLLCICIAMELSLDDINYLLKISGFSELYVKSKRDSIIIKDISLNKTVSQVNEDLYECGENTLNK